MRSELANDLRSPSLDETWREVLGSVDLEEARRAELERWVSDMRRDLLRFVEVVDDDVELGIGIRQRWVELIAHWNALNTQIGFQCVAGSPDPVLSLRGSLVSSMCGVLEGYVPEDYRARAGALLREEL